MVDTPFNWPVSLSEHIGAGNQGRAGAGRRYHARSAGNLVAKWKWCLDNIHVKINYCCSHGPEMRKCSNVATTRCRVAFEAV